MRTLSGNSKILVDHFGQYINRIQQMKSDIWQLRRTIEAEVIGFIKEHKTEFVPEVVVKQEDGCPAKMLTMTNPFAQYFFDEDAGKFYLDTKETKGGPDLQLKVVRKLTEEETDALLGNHIFVVEAIADCFKTHDV